MTDIKFIGGSMKGVGTGFSVPADGVELEVSGLQMENMGTGLEVRDPTIDRAIVELMSKLPQGTTYQQVSDAIKAVQQAPSDVAAQEDAVKKSSIWAALKDAAPAAVAFIIKTATELTKD